MLFYQRLKRVSICNLFGEDKIRYPSAVDANYIESKIKRIGALTAHRMWFIWFGFTFSCFKTTKNLYMRTATYVSAQQQLMITKIGNNISKTLYSWQRLLIIVSPKSVIATKIMKKLPELKKCSHKIVKNYQLLKLIFSFWKDTIFSSLYFESTIFYIQNQIYSSFSRIRKFWSISGSKVNLEIQTT